MRRPLTLLFVLAALMSLSSTTALARPSASVPALSCPGGSVCVWPVTDGSGSRCSWSNSDNDWWNAPVTCSWSSSRTVRAIYNNGTSPNYRGVCLYRGAGYTSFDVFVAQGDSTTLAIGVIMRSHKWVRPGEPC